MTAGLIDCIQTPRQGNRALADAAWCADNGCFTDKWDEHEWWQFALTHSVLAWLGDLRDQGNFLKEALG